MLNVEAASKEIVEQYKSAVGSSDLVFREASKRTRWERWKQNQVGTCVQVMDKEYAERGLFGIAKKLIVKMREKRNSKVPGRSTLTGCPYHRATRGCILGDLKSPLCAAHIDNAWEWKKNFGVDPSVIKSNIHSNLSQILNGDALENPIILEDFKKEMERLRAHISSFPELEQARFSRIRWYRLAVATRGIFFKGRVDLFIRSLKS